LVIVAAGSLAEAAKLLGGASGGIQVQTVTAGWAAGFVAAIAMYFQVAAARDTDRRLVIAGLPTTRLVGARLASGLAVALPAGAAALFALQLRTGIDQPERLVAGTLMFAVIYLAVGAVAGALVRNPVNGTVLILFVWILDVFFGPTMSPDEPATRLLPTHFLSLWMVDLPSHHGGRLGDLGWALAWTLAAAALGWAVIVRTSQVAHPPRRRTRPGSTRDQLAAAVRTGWRDWRRNRVLWALLLVVVAAVFIWLSDAITPNGTTRLTLLEHGRRSIATFNPADIHAGTMTPIAIGSLAALAGLFVAVDTRAGDQRLALAGMRAGVVLAARLAVIGLAGTLATAVSLAVAAPVFDARQMDGVRRGKPADRRHLRATRRSDRVGIRTRQRRVRRLPGAVPGPRHCPEPHAARRSRRLGSLPARLRRHARPARRRPHANLRPDPRATHRRLVAGRPGHRRRGGCLAYRSACGQARRRAIALTHAPKSEPCAMACSGAMPATCCPKSLPRPGAPSWATPGAAAANTSPALSTPTATTRRSITNSLSSQRRIYRLVSWRARRRRRPTTNTIRAATSAAATSPRPAMASRTPSSTLAPPAPTRCASVQVTPSSTTATMVDDQKTTCTRLPMPLTSRCGWRRAARPRRRSAR
jgi:ABC-2 family transporter protein